MTKEVGKTKDVGFQFGIQKTFPIPQEKAWDFMFSDKALKIWLGDLTETLEPEQGYQTKSGIKGHVRVFKPYSHIRMNWKKGNWENMSTLQVRVIGKEYAKSVISFHQEKLVNSVQRAEMKEYWSRRMDGISEELARVVLESNPGSLSKSTL